MYRDPVGLELASLEAGFGLAARRSLPSACCLLHESQHDAALSMWRALVAGRVTRGELSPLPRPRAPGHICLHSSHLALPARSCFSHSSSHMCAQLGVIGIMTACSCLALSHLARMGHLHTAITPLDVAMSAVVPPAVLAAFRLTCFFVVIITFIAQFRQTNPAIPTIQSDPIQSNPNQSNPIPQHAMARQTTAHVTARHDAKRHDTARHGTTRHDKTRQDKTRQNASHKPSQHNTTQHDTHKKQKRQQTLMPRATRHICRTPQATRSNSLHSARFMTHGTSPHHTTRFPQWRGTGSLRDTG